MTTLSPAPIAPSQSVIDNRRAIVRIVGYEIMRIMTSAARLHGGDVIEHIVFTAVWVLNTQHLIGDGRYAQLRSIPPDTLRRPTTLEELHGAVPMPMDIMGAYVERLVDRGLVERVSCGGLVVPTAVFTQPEMLDGTNEIYSRMVSMVTALRNAGFSFGDAD